MAGGQSELDDVLVVIGHPWSDFEVPLTEWMSTGPGPRHGIRPESAKSRTTGEPLALTVIPVAYRNDRESRALIAAGAIVSPWRDVPWDVANWGVPPCEVRGPRPFDRAVADADRIDQLAAQVLRVLPAGSVDASSAQVVSAAVPDFGAAAPLMVRRLAAEARWADLDAIVQLAAAAGLADVAAVLCEVLESDARPPQPGHLVDALGRMQHPAAVDLLPGLIDQFVYAYQDLPGARRCIRALGAIGTGKARARLALAHLSWTDAPEPVRQWLAEESQVQDQQNPYR
ncbi:hypothetical protein FB565_000321 [Actinoplanes lutulentus]|uniref:Uncharacterized protein n=1 Tax=Actinoplanes lutulentus TaxID=1287878 RepID=A0A327ZQ42_9ACTN|nr:HEAT repeat domain-containing protein [Actinoplanes lutulentus]MBB2940617.1 hypothetical protein [Actinoplanes lutulentus]RAK42928.1 hypothetical protein B0I29_10158 [Actinoplanes lutulentus]